MLANFSKNFINVQLNTKGRKEDLQVTNKEGRKNMNGRLGAVAVWWEIEAGDKLVGCSRKREL